MSGDRSDLPERGVGGRNWILGVLTSIYLVNFIDRQILSILLPQVKAEFNLSDTFLGLLVGPTFAFFYATMGLPLALLADRVNRRKLIAASLALFSAMTIACGLVVAARLTRSAGRPILVRVRSTPSALRRALLLFSATCAGVPPAGATATRSNAALGRRSSAVLIASYSACWYCTLGRSKRMTTSGRLLARPAPGADAVAGGAT